MVPIDIKCIKLLQVLKIEQEKANKELGIKNKYKNDFFLKHRIWSSFAFRYCSKVPNKSFECSL